MSVSNESVSMVLGLDQESDRLIIRFSGNIIHKNTILNKAPQFYTHDSTGTYIIVDILDELHSLQSFRIKAYKQRVVNAGWSEEAWQLLVQHPRTTTTTGILLGIIPPSGTVDIKTKLQSLRE